MSIVLARERHGGPPTCAVPASGAIELVASNMNGRRSVLMLTDAYAARACQELRLPRDGRVKAQLSVRASACWYDLTVTSGSFPGWSQRFAGRLETGRHGFSDPLLGG